MSLQPRVFTFYSYKGGVGRSMALLNMAYYLHARGRHVLIVDLDLDAPGASGFLQRNDELIQENGKRDVIDILSIVVDTAREASPEPDTPLPPLPSLRFEAFLRSVRPEKYAKPALANAPRSRLDVLAADMDRDYTSRLSSLELSALSAGKIAAASDILRGILLNHRFPFHQPWQEEGEPPLPTAYDYILVDSRTGLSEIGGLCVGPLSDRLIVLSGLNDQNIAGTKHFLSVIGLEPKARAADAEEWDDDDKAELNSLRPATLGPKPTLLVASPVPGGEMTYKKARMTVLENAIGIAPVKLSYHPQMALMETIFVRDYPDEYLALEYTKLAELVMAMIGDTSEQLNARISRLFGPRRSAEKTNRESAVLPRRITRIALASSQFDFNIPASVLHDIGVAPEILDQTRRLRIALAPSDERKASLWLTWADELDTEEARREGKPEVFRTMEGMYRKAVGLRPTFHEALNNWGAALAGWAKLKTGAEADALFAQAGEKYQHALAIKPDKHEALNNWGSALADWAKLKTGAEADALLAQAVEKYRQALAIKPDFHEALNNWGVALAGWARLKTGAEADIHFLQAGQKYQQALAINPNYSSAWFDIACLAGLRDDADRAVSSLARWKAVNEQPTKSKLDADPDFDRIRDNPKFRAFRDSLPD